MKKYVFSLIALLVLSACAKRPGFDGSERPMMAVPARTDVVPATPSPLDPEKETVLRRSGKIKASDLRGTWEKGQFKLQGKVEVFNKPGQELILMGEVDEGTADLRPSKDSKENSVRAKAFCYSGDDPCSEFFVDMFVMDEKKKIYHDQYVVISPKSFSPPTTVTTLPNINAPVDSLTEKEIEDDVQDGEDDGFVGTSDDSAKLLFEEPKPATTTTPGTRPAVSTAGRNQAVDYCSGGRLQNATDIKKLGSDPAASFKMYRPDRKDGFGTERLATVLQDLGKHVMTMLPNNKLHVGALSLQKGGKNKPHKSHQNGTDADISYLVNNSNLEFKNVVTNSGVKAGLLVSETWSLFKFAFLSGKVEMIFTDAKIKKALCAEAIAKGDLKNAQDKGMGYQILSLIRVTPGHDDHFHLRVKCGTENPLCKTKRYTRDDSGCFASGN